LEALSERIRERERERDSIQVWGFEFEETRKSNTPTESGSVAFSVFF
jgi:hypothetical protein